MYVALPLSLRCREVVYSNLINRPPLSGLKIINVSELTQAELYSDVDNEVFLFSVFRF